MVIKSTLRSLSPYFKSTNTIAFIIYEYWTDLRSKWIENVGSVLINIYMYKYHRWMFNFETSLVRSSSLVDKGTHQMSIELNVDNRDWIKIERNIRDFIYVAFQCSDNTSVWWLFTLVKKTQHLSLLLEYVKNDKFNRQINEF